jgi:hypothetical protein
MPASAASPAIDEDLAFLVLLRTDLAAEVIIGAHEPLAVPAGGADGLVHLPGNIGVERRVVGLADLRASADSSRADSTISAPMNTDSATLPSLLVVVWNDWPACRRSS